MFIGKCHFVSLDVLFSSLNHALISIFHQQESSKPTVTLVNSTNIATYSQKMKYICLYCDLEEKQYKKQKVTFC